VPVEVKRTWNHNNNKSSGNNKKFKRNSFEKMEWGEKVQGQESARNMEGDI
jgi:hypothetical protein